MRSNPVLRALGYSDTDRVVIIHADDIGFCHSSFAAMDGLLNAGIVSSMAAMAVCPWFPAAAEFARAHPAIDLGLHFTLTSEWAAYRWGPLSTRDPRSGLIDAEGFFHRESEPAQKRVKAEAAALELKAQIRRAQAAGIDLTHVDAHMLTAWHPKFLPAYHQIPSRLGLPSFFLRADSPGAKAWGVDGGAAKLHANWSVKLEARGMPLFDSFVVMPLETSDDRIGVARRALAALPPGLSYFVLHPACDTPELRAITPEDWRARAADYQAFTSSELRNFVRDSGLKVIGWRVLRDWMRKKKA
ncbi:MAG: polysaccharide deacetylase family protein [Anaerolineales bacterium]|nr:polysaccharide deacetylase family protein [Anaerolineales bacterium]